MRVEYKNALTNELPNLRLLYQQNYNKLKDIIRLNNFFTSDIRDTRIHFTKRACFCFSELTLALFRLTRVLFIGLKSC